MIKRVKKTSYEILTFWNRILVFAFPVLLITIASGYAYISLVALLLSLLSIGSWQGYRLDLEDMAWCLILGGYGLSWSIHSWLSAGSLDPTGLSLWPLLAAVVLAGLRQHGPRSAWLWGGILCGALGALGIAIHERVFLDAPRATNDMNAIIFGNLSLLFGIVSLTFAAAWHSKRSGISDLWGVLAWIAGMAGVLASILSGTRGGWLVMPVVLWVFYRTYSDLISRRILQRIGAIIATVIFLFLLIPQLGVTARIQQAFDDTEQYFVYGNAETSVGVRLDMWLGGWWLFLEKPWHGWGEGGLEAQRDHYVEQERLTSGVNYYDQLHSDIIDTGARRGAVGLIFLGCLYSLPLYSFVRRLRHINPELRSLALAGLLVPVTYIGFGLTQTMLRDVRGLIGYLGLAVTIWAVLKHKEKEHDENLKSTKQIS